MLDTGPHIHRGCAQLNFHGNGSAFSVSADGHEHHQMQTAVAALLRHGDVVTRADKLPRRRRAQNIRETVHGFHAGKHDAQTGDVVQICRAFRALRQTAPGQLVADGRGRLEPKRHRADGKRRGFFFKLHSRRAERQKRGFHRRFIGRVKRKTKIRRLRRAHRLYGRNTLQDNHLKNQSDENRYPQHTPRLLPECGSKRAKM